MIGAAYTVNNSGELVPLDFTGVAEKVRPAVVHIKSTQMQSAQSSTDPFGELFDDELFRHFFGPNYRYQSPQPKNQQPQAQVGTSYNFV